MSLIQEKSVHDHAAVRTGQPPAPPIGTGRGGPSALLSLITAAGGPRYAVALAVDAVGGGLLRPFLLLYGVEVLHLPAGSVGLALSAGMVVGLLALPLTGRWIDRGARTLPAAVTLLLRAAGALTLLTAHGPVLFTAAAVLFGVGSQSWPTTHAAVVSTLTEGRLRDAALAAGRALRNAGLGAGALLATVAVVGGPGAFRLLAGVTGAACLLAAALVGSLRVRAPQQAAGQPRGTGGTTEPLRRITVLSLANLPYAFCFDVLEVALPALLVLHLHVSAAWSSGVFVGNTVLVIALQLALVLRLAKRPRRAVLAAAGVGLSVSYLGFWAAGSLGGTAGAVGVAAVAVLYTLGEILYTGSGTAMVSASAPPHLLGRALARWELSSGVGRAAAPAVLTALLASGPGLLWGALAVTTAAGALAVLRLGPAE
ncbi:MFS transporter [Streptomyces rubellomurinus]|uniref:MFS transporter n=1 Tax=Streptomyces rubellomurinus (strain ATCC 31215) TaxID=359131 RepID=UPI000AF05DBD|nr:MFS transporter [Streptomyces rubellomurinus]